LIYPVVVPLIAPYGYNS